MPFYGDIDAHCPPTPGRSGFRRMAACAICLIVVLGVAVVL